MVDRDSPLYPAYIEECLALQKEFIRRGDELLERQEREGWRGLDNKESSDLHRELCRRLKAIQKKYGFD